MVALEPNMKDLKAPSHSTSGQNQSEITLQRLAACALCNLVANHPGNKVCAWSFRTRASCTGTQDCQCHDLC